MILFTCLMSLQALVYLPEPPGTQAPWRWGCCLSCLMMHSLGLEQCLPNNRYSKPSFWVNEWMTGWMNKWMTEKGRHVPTFSEALLCALWKYPLASGGDRWVLEEADIGDLGTLGQVVQRTAPRWELCAPLWRRCVSFLGLLYYSKITQTWVA